MNPWESMEAWEKIFQRCQTKNLLLLREEKLVQLIALDNMHTDIFGVPELGLLARFQELVLQQELR